MKKIILLFIITMLGILDANEPIKINIHASCSDAKETFTLTLHSNKLNLSKEALQDNTGGYVNIAEEKYAFVTDKESYRLNASVERSNQGNSNQFVSHIYNHSQKFINTKDLQSLVKNKNLTLIQKINLEQKSNKINRLAIYFDEHEFAQEYQKCEAQIHSSIKVFYIELSLLIVFVLVLLYFVIRKFINGGLKPTLHIK